MALRPLRHKAPTPSTIAVDMLPTATVEYIRGLSLRKPLVTLPIILNTNIDQNTDTDAAGLVSELDHHQSMSATHTLLAPTPAPASSVDMSLVNNDSISMGNDSAIVANTVPIIETDQELLLKLEATIATFLTNVDGKGYGFKLSDLFATKTLTTNTTNVGAVGAVTRDLNKKQATTAATASTSATTAATATAATAASTTTPTSWFSLQGLINKTVETVWPSVSLINSLLLL